MTIKLASLKANLAREEKGDWVDFPDWPGVAFNVSSLHLPAYKIARELMFKKFARTYKKEPVPEAVAFATLGALYDKHILHGWRGLDEPYSADMATKVLTDPEYRNVVAAVEWCAAKISDLDIEFIEDAAKNSEAPSAGE